MILIKHDHFKGEADDEAADLGMVFKQTHIEIASNHWYVSMPEGDLDLPGTTGQLQILNPDKDSFVVGRLAVWGNCQYSALWGFPKIGITPKSS